jgi:uncharacterized membrane protein
MSHKHNPPTLEELKSARQPIRNARVEHLKALSPSEQFAVYIHRRIGSLGFFFLVLLWTAGWLVWNILGPTDMRFDPAPAFVIWIFASNILQLVLLPVIMVGQNIEGRAAEWRSQTDFEINEKAEREIEAILAHLENQNELLRELAHKVEHNS